MNIYLYINVSEPNKIYKELTNEWHITGQLREETSVLQPVINIIADNPSMYNYAYIPEFGRYYYIDDITSIRTNVWRISMRTDVLMSYKENIINFDVSITDSETYGADSYMSGSVWKAKVKEKTDIISFPSGLDVNGKYILITAGG